MVFFKGKIDIEKLVIEATFSFDGRPDTWVFAPLSQTLHLGQEISPLVILRPVRILKTWLLRLAWTLRHFLILSLREIQFTIKSNMPRTRIRLTSPRQVDI